MARNDHPRSKQQTRDLRRRAASRQPIDRLLIVCEGSKTEPNYLNEIRAQLRLPTANVLVRPSELGTAPIQVVKFAEQLFLHGDAHHGLRKKEFDHVYAVFDQDDHASFREAIDYCESLDEKYRNDERKLVGFTAIPSVPCFELWLLLHFEDVQANMHRNEVYSRLKQHLAGYAKGQTDGWTKTQALLAVATGRAARLVQNHQADPSLPYTHMHTLVQRLRTLKMPKLV
jgi:hypothetical protein